MPAACAATRWLGWASTRPAASTRSLMENVCESFFTCTCTGKASLIAKAAAQSTHGRFRAVGAPGSGRTTMTNSATATAASAVVISMIRWGTLSRNARGAVPGEPFVIVVTSLWVQDRQAQSFPDHVTPDHVTPDQVTPDHVTPDQVTPDQVTPDHVTPDHVTPDQVTPDHVTPDHVTPDQVTPDQFVRLAMPEATRLELNARPWTSTLPVIRRPFTDTWTDPRAASREPVPTESRQCCVAFCGVGAVAAAARLTRPLPCAAVPTPGSRDAVPVSSAFTWSGVRSGRCERSSAAEPETTAAACEVPLPRNSRSPMRAAG